MFREFLLRIAHWRKSNLIVRYMIIQMILQMIITDDHTERIAQLN